MPHIELLGTDQWAILRDVRLEALRQEPDSFLARYEDEKEFDEARWRAEFDRGQWSAGSYRRRRVSLLGSTREKNTPWSECFLEYLWVSPEWRDKGLGSGMLVHAIDRLRKEGVRTAFLWVLDGNDTAVRLYRRVGFVSANHRQPLPGRPGRTEELMRLDLD